MNGQPMHPALERILGVDGAGAAMGLLAEGLSGSELTTFLLEVARRRSARRTPADVLAQYGSDRLVAPGQADAVRVARLELLAVESVGPAFEPVVASPLAPLGTHSVLGGVSQNRVVTTMRPGEAAADPTASLALEAAVRRRVVLEADPKSVSAVSLAAVSRVLRAQVFEAANAFQHFSLLGLVTAGRDAGNHDFEVGALTAHLRALLTVVDAAVEARVVIRVSDLDGRFGDVVQRVAGRIRSGRVAVEPWPGRTDGVGYYPGVCFKLAVLVAGEELEVADGGLVDWTQLLLQSRKERLMISGLGLERLALLNP